MSLPETQPVSGRFVCQERIETGAWATLKDPLKSEENVSRRIGRPCAGFQQMELTH